MSFEDSAYLNDLQQVQGDLCVYCGFTTGFRKAAGHHFCCAGCANESGCTCDPVAAVVNMQLIAHPLAAAAPPHLVQPRLACQSCRLFVANTDDGFETCCQGCIFGGCTCTNGDQINAVTIMIVSDFHDAEAAWSDADHTQMVQDNSTSAPSMDHKKLSSKQVKQRLKRCADDSTGFCAVCQSTDTDPASKLSCCGQRFHTACIETWLMGHKASCPTCNHQF